MSAICRTCGGEVPNHLSSQLDPNGTSHPGHKVLPFKESVNGQKPNIRRDTRYLTFAEKLIAALPENREDWKTVIAQHIYDLVTPEEYIDHATRVRMLIEHDNPGYPEHPRVTIVCPDGHQLTIEQVNDATKRLSELAAILPMEQESNVCQE